MPGVFSWRDYGRALLASERPRLMLWSPMGLMLGIGSYFSLNEEPADYSGPLALAVGAVLLGLTWHRALRLFTLPLALIALGFCAAQLRSHVVATPLLTRELHNRRVEGTIDEIEPVEKKEKLVLSDVVIEGLAPTQTPERLRVSFRGHDTPWKVGDRIRFTASLYPLPEPNMPGGYDFARHFYFRHIGGTGFAMRAPDGIEPAATDRVHVWLSNIRHRIGEDMRGRMPGSVGTVAAAMTVGETGPIPEETKASLRNSGLAHMLAIAGLHLGIVTSIIFYTLRLLLTLYPPLALRLPVKKIAAVAALFGAWIYLCLAGFPIPAQRAFVMVAFFFTAILLDRRGITLRTLSLAAVIILLLFPESMFTASFQMSFAATLAIVSVYEHYGRRLYKSRGSWLGRVYHHALGITVTSLVATLATVPFVLYHFNRFALLGLIANMVVVPLATFVIMPGMVLGLLLMPLGLQAIGYAPLSLGTRIMIAMGDWVTSLPYASLSLPSLTESGLILSSAGLVWLCLVKHRSRLAGLAPMAAGLASIALHVPVDMFISRDARQVMLRLPDGHYTALRGTERSFTIQNWLRSEGQDMLVPRDESQAQCNTTLCRYQHPAYSVTLFKKRDDQALDQACLEEPDVLIAWRYLHSYRCHKPKLLIGRVELEQYGAHALRLGENGFSASHSKKGPGKRFWHVRPPLENEENAWDQDD